MQSTVVLVERIARFNTTSFSFRTICGLTQYTNKSHIARACLEAVCFQTREVSACREKNMKNLGVVFSNFEFSMDENLAL